ncbi:unnamed protein product [Protopolystoma xenopodis]|uniref:Dynein heavy chain AAA module D4 domain-containing protein n=1 Tax=Protopolystoma xenopodis TaxID=117903 RepID=A0A3S5AV49_9PLAT|nr:unnamed protein product [Protopolystoma xenopodis]
MLCNVFAYASAELYDRVLQRFKPTPTRCHYIFSTRDYVRLLLACLRVTPDSLETLIPPASSNNDDITTAGKPPSHESADSRKLLSKEEVQSWLVRLWMHEAHRTFYDRLIGSKDQEDFTQMVESVTERAFKVRVSKLLDSVKDSILSFGGEQACEEEDESVLFRGHQSTGPFSQWLIFADCLHPRELQRMRLSEGERALAGLVSGNTDFARIPGRDSIKTSAIEEVKKDTGSGESENLNKMAYMELTNHMDFILQASFFCSLPPRFYNYFNHDFCADFIQDQSARRHLEEYNSTADHPISMHLCSFVLQHVTRLARALRQPNGHCLMLGLSGSGRRSIASLAGLMIGFAVFHVPGEANLSLAEWHRFIANILSRAARKENSLILVNLEKIKDHS